MAVQILKVSMTGPALANEPHTAAGALDMLVDALIAADKYTPHRIIDNPVETPGGAADPGCGHNGNLHHCKRQRPGQRCHLSRLPGGPCMHRGSCPSAAAVHAGHNRVPAVDLCRRHSHLLSTGTHLQCIQSN